jgi:hypothetical protein
VFLSVPLPVDLDTDEDLIVEIDASKTGATVGDATTFTIGAWLVAAGDLRDADADAGGATNAMTGNATSKTVQTVSRTITAANVPANARVLTLSIKPTNGTLGTDDVTIHACRVRATRSLA